MDSRKEIVAVTLGLNCWGIIVFHFDSLVAYLTALLEFAEINTAFKYYARYKIRKRAAKSTF